MHQPFGSTGRPIRFGVTQFWKNSIPCRVMKARGWRETEGDDWDFFYGDVAWIHENMTYSNGNGFRCSDNQKVNHYPNHVELTQKDLMAKNLKRALKQAQKEGNQADVEGYGCFPMTFTLPSDASLMIRAYKEKGGVWIFKPVRGLQGRGIFLVNKLSQIEEWLREQQAAKEREERVYTVVAQQYIANPYLVGGKKFDMRIFALCLSFSPLKVYLYREGFCRFSNARFSLTKKDLANTQMHLTNHAVQKKDDKYSPTQTDLKWPIQCLKTWLLSHHGLENANRCFGRIQQLIIASLRSVQNTIINDRHCCEMYGYDVMIDSDLRPWLIEVNSSPALSASDQTDYDLKTRLVDDFFTCVDMEGRLGKQVYPRIGGFDLIVDNNQPVANSDWQGIPSGLGLHNDRIKALERLARAVARNNGSAS
uniref:Tubulin--tyrosine ligase-like protein 9 n=1 Tax=Tetraselmis chuii TaxID=63592 RepID=A0A7S1SVZ6_9CHLO|mmetsp:Transcript_28467/g.50849  ORF Transcript_28467/g.50849 Transcript_28467/m.50849 type:complete len:422 (+) Transcript_28467:262-1527(+)